GAGEVAEGARSTLVTDDLVHAAMWEESAPPAEVVRLAAEAGLSALALTDHDTLDHVGEGRAAADAFGLRLVPGCEISCELSGRAPGGMHPLGFFVDDGPGGLQGRLAELQGARHERDGQSVEAAKAPGGPTSEGAG